MFAMHMSKWYLLTLICIIIKPSSSGRGLGDPPTEEAPVPPPTPPPNTITVDNDVPYILLDLNGYHISYESADAMCAAFFGTCMAVISPDNTRHTVAEQWEFATDLCQDATGDSSCWLGLRYMEWEGAVRQWRWCDGSTISSVFGSYDPDPSDNTECMIISGASCATACVWTNVGCVTPHSSHNVHAALCNNPYYSDTSPPTPSPTSRR